MVPWFSEEDERDITEAAIPLSISSGDPLYLCEERIRMSLQHLGEATIPTSRDTYPCPGCGRRFLNPISKCFDCLKYDQFKQDHPSYREVIRVRGTYATKSLYLNNGNGMFVPLASDQERNDDPPAKEPTFSWVKEVGVK